MKHKFRAWDKENARWMTPEIEHNEESEIRLDLWGHVYFKKPWFEQEPGTITIVSGESTFDLSQSTEVKDMDGVEIFEGDIVKVTQYFGGVAYGELMYLVEKSKYNNNLMLIRQSKQRFLPELSLRFNRSDDYEVIGNIWENPELLEVAE